MIENVLFADRSVTLEEILLCRENRAARQKKMLEDGGRCLVSFTMNIAGPIKQFPLARYGFEAGVAELLALLPAQPLKQELTHADTGSEGLFLLDADPCAIKKLTIQLEQAHPLNRLFDFDVLNGDGKALSRREFGSEPRPCLICGGNAKACARSRAHDPKLVRQKTLELLCQYHINQTAD